ncbi:hypothetical protein K227x_05660 [Rubripirellula lacrimiformis]|uniref:3-keto-alpha-glucoside-1,2-lyase/3-keto-2-hydroxy-glucal hydratase domain-containing protein n=1 Tax=Rubripirellula lacrimiformis TaxID=1930273 RepID=A0A517N4Y3_9BACT|nr:DUF1080 domain-containing protein [Rubripirellula lacrimiformis]QDT02194.1 hypothetical protein K227x_05660 [Rubripirellula lacrimiformis]
MNHNQVSDFNSFNRGWLVALAIVASFLSTAQAEDLSGDWSVELESGLPAWMRVVEEDGQSLVYMRLYIGPTGPYKAEQVDGRLKFEIRRNPKKKNGQASVTRVDVGLNDGKLDGVLDRQLADGTSQRDAFTGKRVPPMPESAPELSKVRFGHPISLFNGKDISGWRTYESDKTNGWSVIDGMLVNSTTKTDFSPTGSYANLRTEAEFEDFWLHIEFLVEEARNSGIYLRGMYEAQVVDRDSRMQGIQGVGAIFGAIAPSVNAGNPGGQWQTYDLTLVDRHVTVVLNGVKVIDNQPIDGPTAGAIYTNAAAPGPIYLQGDHTTVSYRDIYLAPVVSKQ